MGRAPVGHPPSLFPALLLLSLAPRGGAASPPLPGEAQGEIAFVGDAGLFLDANGREEVYFCLAVPQGDLRCVALEGREGEWAQILVELGGMGGGDEPLQERRQVCDLPCVGEAEATPALRRLVHLRAPWPDAPLDFRIRVNDRNALRTGLVYKIRGEERRGTLQGSLERPPLGDGTGLSSCIFLWDLDVARFERQGRLRVASADSAREAIEPNPMRGYGLLLERLAAYVELYGLEGRAYDVQTRVRAAADGSVALAEKSRLEVPWARTALVVEADVAGLLAGSYDLEIELRPKDAGEPARATHAHFQMLWRPESWGRTQAELADEMGLLLDPARLDAYRALEPGAREAFSESLWADVDGFSLPGTWNGPTRALFAERVAAADLRFAAGGVRGSLTDRGRVFVRYGEPNEVLKELLPTERDQIANFLEREIPDAERSEGSGLLHRNAFDASAYEVWYYMHRGEPLMPGEEPPGGGRELKFVFVDPLGNGRYRLIYSNLYGGLR